MNATPAEPRSERRPRQRWIRNGLALVVLGMIVGCQLSDFYTRRTGICEGWSYSCGRSESINSRSSEH
jgi:hypothetical protein